MKKAILALIVIIAAVGAAVGISVYGKKHIHQYTYKAIREADCTHEGLADYICTECGQTYEDIIPKTHKYVDTVVEPTYDEEGYTLPKCSVCGDEYKDEITPKLMRPYDDIGGAVLNGLEESYQYTGEAIVPEIIVMLHDEALTVNKDYTMTIENNTEPGEAKITVTGQGDFKNTLVKTFKINRVGWEEKDGLKYYYNGELSKGITEIEGEKYFFDEDGVMQTGWQKVGDDYYCFDRIDGFMMTDGQVDGINVDAEGKAVKAGAAIVSTDEEDPALVTFRMVRNTAEGDQKTYDIVVEAYEGEELQVQMNAQVTAAENHIQAEVTMKRAEDGQLNPALAMSYDYTATESEDAIAVRTVQEQKLWQPSTRSVTGDDGESKWEIYYPEEPSMVLRTEGSSVVQQTADGFTVKSDSAFIVPTISEDALFTVHGIVKSAPAPAAVNTENAIHPLKMSQEELDAFLQNLATNTQTKLVTLMQQLPQSVLTLIMQTAQ